MKKLFIVGFLFLVSAMCFSETWETKTVITEEGRKSFTVRVDIYIIEQTSFHVDTNSRNSTAWIVIRKRARMSNENKWSAWYVESELPLPAVPDFNTTLMLAMEESTKYSLVLDVEGIQYLGIWTKNGVQEYWWEDRTYLITQRNLYVIK
jgi:hypothetical protein